MLDIRDLYRHWVMHTPVGYQIANLGSIIGMFAGAVICFCINCCACSCSHKTTQVQTESNSQVTASASAGHKDSLNYEADMTTAQKILSETESWWNATWSRRTYSYDSLGNQTLASEESATINGNKRDKDSVNNSTFSSATFIITNTDTIHDTINAQQHDETAVVTYSVPWYWKIGAYIGYIIICISLLTLLVILIRKKVLV